MKKDRIGRSVAAILVAVFAGSCTESDHVPVRMATLFGKEHHLAKKLEWTARELEQRSQGRFRCEVFPGSVMGGEKENLEDLLLGNLELMNGAGSYYYRYVPEAGVIEMPLYGWEDREEAWRVIRAYWPQFVTVSEKKGFHPVALDIRDYWGIFYREPIDSLEAIRNAQFRSVNAELWIELTKLYDAVPNPIQYADAYMAFKTGVADGTLTSVTGGTSANWHEVLKGFLETRLVLSNSFTLTSKQWLEDLPPDLREIFLEVCRDSEAFNLEQVDSQYERNRQQMLDAGVKWVSYEDLDLSTLHERARTFRDEFMQKLGPEAYEFYLAWLDHVEKETGRPQLRADADE
jgi:TRAP-type C4-dicarboxylate transport system substrate-binding protein